VVFAHRDDGGRRLSAGARGAVGQATAPPSPAASPLAGCPSTPGTRCPQVVVKNLPAPDDLAFGLDGRLLFSDIKAGNVSALNPDGSVERLAAGLSGPKDRSAG